jgi:L-alanine-DL-glutamate epimerase-like enolase superfamily enzyme
MSRTTIIREEIGDDLQLMMDANQNEVYMHYVLQ